MTKKALAAESAAVTRLLSEWRAGDGEALDRLAPIVYDELKRLAGLHMRGERDNHVLQTTALVHEAYMRLVDLELPFRDRVHFYSVATRMMRRVLVDFARRRDAAKRGAGIIQLPLDDEIVGVEVPDQILALDDALERLAASDERKAKVVELRYFGGFTIEETAEALGTSHATVERDLRFAKAWLIKQLAGTPDA